MDPLGAIAGESLGNRHRVVVVGGLPVVVALAKADDPSAAQVDRRVELSRHVEAATVVEPRAT